MDADVLIQAGHQGKVRNKGSGTAPSHGASGTSTPEHQMTPVVADAAESILTNHGVDVVRVPALFPRKFEVQLGLALHFDGSGRPCSSGASVGYPPGVPLGSNKPTADLWKSMWSQWWPFQWMKDNFTRNLSGYYGYGWMSTGIAEMLIEFGEISCPEQDSWLQPRLEWIGSVVAHFVGEVLGADVPAPLPFGDEESRPEALAQTDPWDDDIADLRLELADLRAQVASMSGGSRALTRDGAASDATEYGDLDHEEW